MTRVPSPQGTSVAPVPQPLKHIPGARGVLPSNLHWSLDEKLMVSGWYPEEDYWVLISTLAKLLDPNVIGADPWRFFAKTSAQTDIGGKENKASGAAASASKG